MTHSSLIWKLAGKSKRGNFYGCQHFFGIWMKNYKMQFCNCAKLNWLVLKFRFNLSQWIQKFVFQEMKISQPFENILNMSLNFKKYPSISYSSKFLCKNCIVELKLLTKPPCCLLWVNFRAFSIIMLSSKHCFKIKVILKVFLVFPHRKNLETFK